MIPLSITLDTSTERVPDPLDTSSGEQTGEPVGTLFRGLEGVRLSRHARLYPRGPDATWVFHFTKRYPWTVRAERRAKNARAKQARKLNR